MARVFVSYSSAETALTRYLHEVLVAEGHDVFLDRHLQDGIHPSQNWKNNLFERLRWADAVVGLVSDAYVTSQWCFAEIAIAQTLGRVVLPVVVAQDVRHPLLDAIQHINYAADPVAGLARLTAELRDIDAAGGGGWPDGRSPFPGLKAFEADLRQAFFGRRDENRSLAGMLRAQIDQGATQMLVVVGPSGCGKSSLVRAGLLPTMAADPGWLTMPALTPAARAGGSADPVAGLAVLLATEARFVGLTWTVRDVAARLEASIGLAALVDELLVAAPGRRRRLLLVVDQFEELLTQTPPDLRRHFVVLLREGMVGRLAVVATLRPEFLAAVQADDSIGGLARQIIELAPLRRESLRTVVEQPCQLAGIGIDRELVDLLVADANAGEALPLLAFTLRELADGVTRGGHLSAARYHELGGVVGALAGQADLAMTAAQARTGRSRDEVISGLLRLVTVDEQDRPTRWRTPVTDLPEAVRAELDEFVRHRLLVTDTRAGIAVVAVAHEAFLTGWPPLARAIAERATALKMRPQVENAARQWSNGGHASVNLWEGNQLASAVADTGAHPMPNRIGLRRRQVIADRIELSADARTFLHACIRRERRRRTRTVTILASLLAIALVGAGAALVGQRDARNQQKLADQQRTVAVAHGLVAQAESIRGRDPRTALRLGVAARHVTDDDAARAGLFKTVTSTTITASLTGHTASVTSMAWSPDRHTLATASRDRTVLLWDFTDWDRPARIGSPLTGTADVTSVAWSPDGRTIATGSEDQTVTLWDVTDHARPTRIAKPIVVSAVTDYVNSVNALVWSLDGRTLASASDDGTLILWNLTDRSRPVPLGAPLTPKPDGLMSVAWSPDGRTLAGGSFNDGLVFWDVHDPTRPRRIGTGAANTVSTVAWSPDGRTLAIGIEASKDAQSETDGNASTESGSVALWDVTNPARSRPLGEPVPGHTRSVNSVAWSPDGRRLATGSWDGAMIIWDVSDRARPHRAGAALTGHTEAITTVVWAPDGHTVVSGGVDATNDHLGPCRPVPATPHRQTTARCTPFQGCAGLVPRRPHDGWPRCRRRADAVGYRHPGPAVPHRPAARAARCQRSARPLLRGCWPGGRRTAGPSRSPWTGLWFCGTSATGTDPPRSLACRPTLPTQSRSSPGRLTATRWPSPPTTPRCPCGTSPTGPGPPESARLGTVASIPSIRWRGPQTDIPWPAVAFSARRCGTSPTGPDPPGSASRSAANPPAGRRSRGPRTDTRWPWPPSRVRWSSGTSPTGPDPPRSAAR